MKCLCGCGNITPTFTRSYPDRGIVKGVTHVQYLRGHAPRKDRPNHKGRPKVKEGYRYCSRCHAVKLEIEFSKSKLKGGLEDACKTCHCERTRQHRQKDRTRTNLYAKFHRWRHLNGFSREIFYLTLEVQQGCCKICGDQLTRSKDIHIDHCHTTNTFRGILCNKCNVGLGYFRDDPVLLQKAIEYLQA